MALLPDTTEEPDRPLKAAGLMLTALMLLAFQDGMVRFAGPETSLWQFQWLRAAFNLCFLLIIARVLWGTLPKRPKRLWAVALRSLLLISAMLFFFAGVPDLTLSEMAAGLYTFPIWVTLLSALFLGERVGPWRVTAVAMAAAGAILILQPYAHDFHWKQVLPLGAGLCYAGVVLTTRRLCRTESTVTLAFGVGVAFLLLGTVGVGVLSLLPPGPEVVAEIPYLAVAWPELVGSTVAIALLCSSMNVVANLCLARAYQSAESSWLAPIDYCYLIFAAFWGFVLFSDVPGAATLAGMGMIAAAGALTAWRERRLNKPAPVEIGRGRR